MMVLLLTIFPTVSLQNNQSGGEATVHAMAA
jgi:hypothetical protein